MFIKLGKDEVLMALYMHEDVSAISVPGRIQGRAKISQGVPILKKTSFFLAQKATATNQMHSNDLEACGMKFCCFWFHSEVKFFTRSLYSGERQWPFGPLVLLIHFALFNVIWLRFLCSKENNLHLFCKITMFVSGRFFIKDLNVLRILMNVLCIYLGKGRGGDCTDACICMGTHSHGTNVL